LAKVKKSFQTPTKSLGGFEFFKEFMDAKKLI
jgi:hypothetical protein